MKDSEELAFSSDDKLIRFFAKSVRWVNKNAIKFNVASSKELAFAWAREI